VRKHPIIHSITVAVVLIVALLVFGVSLRTVYAAPPAQEAKAELTIEKTAEGDGTIAPGGTVRFNIAVVNTGAITATNVVIEDDYDQVAFPTIEAGASGAQNDGQMIVWQIGDLLPGESWSTSYAATAAASFEGDTTAITNEAAVYVDGEEAARTSVDLSVRAPQLTLTRLRERVDHEGEIIPGASVRYTLRYGNNGTANATNVIIEEIYDDTVVQQVEDIVGGGLLEEGRIRWNLGTVAAGASGEVAYEVTLKPGLGQGDSIEVLNQATLQADGVKKITAVGSFTLDTPVLSIERKRDDLSGGTIAPGDTLRFTITIRNSGEADALDVVVLDDFDETVVAEVSDISVGGSEVEGTVRWSLADPLEPGGEKSFSYQVRLISEMGESTSVENKAVCYIRDVEVARSQTTMKIEVEVVPPAEEGETVTAVVDSSPQIFEQKPETLAWLVGVTAGLAMLAVAGTALGGPVLMKDKWSPQYLQLAIEGVAVIVLVAAVLVLAMGSGIRQDGAVSILSTIGGYVLGRSITTATRAKDSGT
jgi:uncharacterized repeat protein (TIGR01451 family)